ncbi:MAG: hypothetical protein KIB09_01115 [Firmicutes bacterium]|nr:hypothetical protein [Bacillota bacterium]
MELKERLKKHENLAASLLMTVAVFAVFSIGWDFYYDLNDDVLIKDVLSGVYSGSPSGYTMQLLYPLGFVLSVLYRALSLPVFGIFLVLCQFGAVWAVGYQSAECCKSRKGKAAALISEAILWISAFGMHLVYIQYTVTAGMLAAAALFWILTAKRRRWFALVLYWLAFCLRTEIALLLLPLACVAGLCALVREWKKERAAVRYFSLFGILILGMGALYAADAAAYSAPEWKQFRQFFDDRTALYDYRLDFVEQYEENRAVYEKLGISQERQQLLANYNFGADDEMDAVMMHRLAQEASAAQEKPDFKKELSVAVWRLAHENWFGKGDAPFNLLWLGMGILLCIFFCMKRRFGRIWQPLLGGASGTALWLYLLLQGRMVERVTHPLYLAQILLFVGMLFAESRAADAEGRQNAEVLSLGLAAGICALTGLACLPGAVSRIEAEAARREEVNAANEAVMDYCRAHPKTLYLEDVYSTVAYSEKLMTDRDKPFNYDLMGGWLVKSPLTSRKLSAFGFSSMGEAVRAGEGVNILAEEGSDMSWLKEFFADTGVEAELLRVGGIEGGTDIYQVIPAERLNGTAIGRGLFLEGEQNDGAE